MNRYKRSVSALTFPMVGVLVLVAAAMTTDAWGQRGAGGPVGGTAQVRAPFDVTGYWVTAITEDWRVRMITPQRGDFLGLPLNEAGIELANAWDPEADMANGDECRAFGAAAIMRSPTRIHVTWEDENTLRFEFDHGDQTRMVYFDQSMLPGERSYQGHATAEWIDTRVPARGGFAGRGGGFPDVEPGSGPPRPGGLEVVTTNLLHQYHRQNGTPVSENAVVTDQIDLVAGPANQDWLIVKTIIEDPQYMFSPMVTSAQFKRESDDSNWNPQPCQVELPFESRLPNLRLN